MVTPWSSTSVDYLQHHSSVSHGSSLHLDAILIRHTLIYQCDTSCIAFALRRW